MNPNSLVILDILEYFCEERHPFLFSQLSLPNYLTLCIGSVFCRGEVIWQGELTKQKWMSFLTKILKDIRE